MPDDRSVTGRECGAVRPLLPAYARGDLEEKAEDDLRRHADGCTACRAALAEVDPAALFLALRGRTLPGEFWQGFDRSLRERLAQAKQGGWRWSLAWEVLESAFRPPRLAYFAAPLAMVFVLGVTLFVTRPGLFAPGARLQPPGPGLKSPYDPPAAPRRGAAGTRVEREAPVIPAIAPAGLAAEPPPLEEVRSPAARIYRLDVAGQDPTPIYMVVDETIDF